MLQRLRLLFLSTLVAMIALLAQVGAASACTGGHYEPDVPAQLRR